VTYSALAPEHAITKYLLKHDLLDAKVKERIEAIINMTEIERAKEGKEGFDLGLTVMHPLTNQEIPVWTANFVLASYGGGAVMAVPAHDERDFEFATQYDLPIKRVISGGETLPYTLEGTLENSDTFTGMKNTDAKAEIIAFFQAKEVGSGTTNYKLRNWGVSRQRYWGAPICLMM